MQMKVGEIATLVEATLIGDPEAVVTGVAAIADAGPGDVTFCAQAKYAALVPDSEAAAVLIPNGYTAKSRAALLSVSDPYHAFLRVARAFQAELPPRPRVFTRGPSWIPRLAWVRRSPSARAPWWRTMR